MIIGASQELHSTNVGFCIFQIHVIDFDDESNVINKNVFMHSAGEIW